MAVRTSRIRVRRVRLIGARRGQHTDPYGSHDGEDSLRDWLCLFALKLEEPSTQRRRAVYEEDNIKIPRGRRQNQVEDDSRW